jgi:hypothetical protein
MNNKDSENKDTNKPKVHFSAEEDSNEKDKNKRNYDRKKTPIIHLKPGELNLEEEEEEGEE